MKSELKGRGDWTIFVLSVVFFMYIIYYCIATNFRYYIADSIIFIVFTIILFLFYKQWRLNTLSFFFLVLAFVLHDLGAFKFYAAPPIPIEWDVVTHLVGLFAVGLFVYNLVLERVGKKHHLFLLFIVIFTAMGIGVMIEFVEFYGFMTVGFGEGFLGHGFGDYDPAIVSSDYIDTIQDLYWNFVGATLGFIVGFFNEKRLRSRIV